MQKDIEQPMSGVTKCLRGLGNTDNFATVILYYANSIMKMPTFVLTIAAAFATAPVQAKKTWNGPDLHGINTESTPTVILSSPQASLE